MAKMLNCLQDLVKLLMDSGHTRLISLITLFLVWLLYTL